MAAPAASDTKLVRCPYCLKVRATNASEAPDLKVKCAGCARSYYLRSAVAVNYSSLRADQSELAAIPTTTLAKSIGLVATLLIVTYFVDGVTRGPQFLEYYFGVYIFLHIVISRICKGDTSNKGGTILLCGMLFVIVGIERLMLGSARGMKNFQFLYVGMAIGMFTYIARMVDWTTVGTGSCSSSSCSSSSSCGGGGCGGGGCGGCGGS